MSMSDGEPCEDWVIGFETAKGHHKKPCDACGAKIRKGDTFYSIREKAFGEPWRQIKQCARCYMIYDHLIDRIGGDGYDEFIDPRLACGHTYKERFGKEPAPEIANLAFMSRDEAQAALAEKESG